MCGRFTLRTPTPTLVKQFGLSFCPELTPRYNVAPTQDVAVVRPLRAEDGSVTGRELVLMRWGLIPSWAKDPSIGNRMINARAATVADKPAFRKAFQRRRCLVIADGYFEWRKLGSRKQPYWIRLRDERPFGMAGLWERWHGGPGMELESPWESCTIITTDAGPQTREIHDRMPVILNEADWDLWFDDSADRSAKEALFQPSTDSPLRIDAVSTRVNSVQNDDPLCIAIQAHFPDTPL